MTCRGKPWRKAPADDSAELGRPSSSRARQRFGGRSAGSWDFGCEGKAPAPSKEPVSKGNPADHSDHHNIETLGYSKSGTGEGAESQLPGPELPASLRRNAKLLPHQLEGLAWLQGCYARRDEMSGCLLADDMGLGKTLQSLCLIAWQDECAGEPKPSLVVAPVSLLENWRLEIQKFMTWSDTDVLSLYGDALSNLRIPASQLESELMTSGIHKLLRPGFADGFKLVLTTYETLRDYEFSLAPVPWRIVVCDEAQKIKNPAAFVTQAAKALKSDFRIACTGTPVENSLADLWCLFDFFQPGHLRSLNEFTKNFRRDIETRADGHLVLIEKLRSETKPWILRRMKSEVHRGLPNKIEGPQADASSVALPMSPIQATLYGEAVTSYRTALAYARRVLALKFLRS